MLPLLKMNRDKPQFKTLKLQEIQLNPNQPRKFFDAQAINELAESIRQYGIINPLTVRQVGEGYELIAGERRWRASHQLGLQSVPCYVLPGDDAYSSIVALVENLQRQDLDFYEEAMGISRLIQRYELTQQQVAQRLGKTQSAVANKLRLLRLPQDVIALLRAGGLGERHARALLRLPEADLQRKAAHTLVEQSLTVAQAEAYIEKLLHNEPKKQKRHPKVLQDVRLFINTMNRAVDTMRKAGVGAAIARTYEGDDMVVTIRIPAAEAKTQSCVSQ